MAPFRIPSSKKKGIFGMYPETAGKTRGRLGRRFWRNAFLINFIGFNMLKLCVKTKRMRRIIQSFIQTGTKHIGMIRKCGMRL